MQVAVGNRAATDERRRPAPESLTVRSKSFAHGTYAATTMMGDVCAPLSTILRAASAYLEFRVRLTTSAQRFAEVSAAGPLRNPMTQNAGVLATAAPRR